MSMEYAQKRFPKAFGYRKIYTAGVRSLKSLRSRTSNAPSLCRDSVVAQYVKMQNPQKEKYVSVRLGSWNKRGGKNEFWDELNKIMTRTPEKGMVILGGDLNGHELGKVKSTVDFILAKRYSHRCFKNDRTFCNEACVKKC
ncbi:hypothetical protein HELRODRAFT_158568 [Helobdella robusta]|uniref:Endonuclease/exonuclease/phosphatase domain-containing protein n=1 Tax=Helobdella robusta TaxID=6412 RepID=T1EMY5_HELRO|nr:hypothetical protein HELRODRAFT_158568 [Helobdella robusta]ESO12128.1 hypothetical protein HELRODRAFT_158568 [Helobdella robusta]